jgi:hypothetical protein
MVYLDPRNGRLAAVVWAFRPKDVHAAYCAIGRAATLSLWQVR